MLGTVLGSGSLKMKKTVFALKDRIAVRDLLKPSAPTALSRVACMLASSTRR